MSASSQASPPQQRRTRRIEKNFTHQVEQVLATRDTDDPHPVIMMAEDEGRFGRLSERRRWGAPKPLRPTVPRQVVREWVDVCAAVCPQLGQVTALILP
jgi:hypothetical protein